MELVAPKLYTADEYLVLEEQSFERNEFVNGEIIPMAGETPTANKIAGNFYLFFRLLLRQMKQFEVFDHEVKLMVNQEKIYRYPDLVVVNKEGVAKKWVTQPIFIAEVISESTEKTDRTKKRVEYCSLSTTQYYLIVHQDEPCVEVFRRNDKKWEFEFYTNISEQIELPYFEAVISLNEIYEGIEFEQNTATIE